MLFHVDVIGFYRDLGVLIPHSTTGLIIKGYLWVDFFFLLSGFIIQHSYGDRLSSSPNWTTTLTYLKARFWRIYPLHLFTLLALIPFVLILPEIHPSVVDGSWTTFFDWSALGQSLLLINAHGQHSYLAWNILSWSIGAEASVYVLGIAWIILLRRRGVITASVVGVASFFALALLVYGHSGNTLDITYDWGVWRCLFGFLIGVSLHSVYRQARYKALLERDWVLVIVFALIATVLHFQLHDLAIIPVFALVVLCAAYNAGRIQRLMHTRPLQYLGKISYSIYLMHGVWFMVFWYGLPILAGALGIASLDVTHHVAIYSLFITVTLISADFSYRFIEVPFRKGFPTMTLNRKSNTKTSHV